MAEKDHILIVAAHPDDEILGCGGTAAIHARNDDTVHVLIVAEGATSRGSSGNETGELKDAARSAAGILGLEDPVFLGLPDNRLDREALLDVTQKIERVINKIKPGVVYTHHGGDLNIDHRIVHQGVVTACRFQPGSPVKKVLTFETASSTEWSTPSIGSDFRPNYFVNISDVMDIKRDALEAYHMEMRPFPHARSIENIEAMAKVRGASVGVSHAEAFMLLRELKS